MRTDETYDMGHIIHQNGSRLFRMEELTDLRDRFGVKDHAFSEYDQLWVITFEQTCCFLQINPIGIVLTHRKIKHSIFFGNGILCNIITKSSHRLGTKVTALANMIIHHHRHAGLF